MATGIVNVPGVTWPELLALDPSDIGAAAESHSHAASDITSGTLAVARGGTGKESVTSGSYLVGNGTSAMTEKTPAQVLSDIGAAAESHSHAASDVSSGTFGVARGGTGKSSVTTGNYLVGAGTSAMTEKTPAQVLSDIGAATVTSGSATCPASSSWSGPTNGLYYTTVSIANFTTSTRVHITPVISTSDTSTGEAQQEAWDTHYYAETVSGGIKFYAEEAPTVAVTFNWEVVA